MSKPINSTEWASDANALVVQPSSVQREFGWSTSDNTTSGQPVRPNLQQQNGWQKNVHEWLQYFDGKVGDALGYKHLWNLPLYNLQTVGTQSGTYIDTINQVSGKLTFMHTDNAYTFDYTSAKGEIMNASRFHETLDMFGRGISLRLVDGAGTIWYIVPNDLTSYVTTNNLSADNPFNLSNDIETNGNAFYDLDPSNNNAFFIYTTTDDIQYTNESDFSSFVELNVSNYLTQNPDGISAVLFGNQKPVNEFSLGSYSLASASAPKRHQIRSLIVADPDISIVGSYWGEDMFFELEQLKTYEVNIQAISRQAGTNNNTVYYQLYLQSDFTEIGVNWSEWNNSSNQNRTTNFDLKHIIKPMKQNPTIKTTAFSGKVLGSNTRSVNKYFNDFPTFIIREL